MGLSSIVKNSSSGESYIVSTTYRARKYKLRHSIGGVEFSPQHVPTTFETAIYQARGTIIGLPDILKMYFVRPRLVFHLMSRRRYIEKDRDEFHKLICTMVQHEKIEDLADETSEAFNIYDKYKCVATSRNYWSLYFFKRVQHIFIIPRL